MTEGEIRAELQRSPTNEKRRNYETELEAIYFQRARLFDIVNRFVRSTDGQILSDKDFALAVFERWAKDRGVHLGDPNE